MGMCPLCNGFKTYTGSCSSCGNMLVDAGKLTDFLDDYSAYMEMDLMKMVDGELTSFEEEICVHLFTCPHCKADQVIYIKE